jgi:hypothetical protein
MGIHIGRKFGEAKSFDGPVNVGAMPKGEVDVF